MIETLRRAVFFHVLRAGWQGLSREGMLHGGRIGYHTAKSKD